MSYVKSNLDNWIEEETAEYGDCIIDEQSISNSFSDDGYEFYPALSFTFIDGATYTVIVHDNP